LIDGLQDKNHTHRFSDLQKGIDFYQHQQQGLGKRFSEVVEATLDRIKSMPLSASIAYGDVRYKLVEKFPYVLLYNIDGPTIVILCIFHTHQQPEYLK
jgi:plasmid stabilization system protein ParE